MLDESKRVIVTLPIYKDTGFLENAVMALEAIVASIASDFVILIPEDGSDSSEQVSRLKSKYQNIIHIQHDQRLGRGKALRDAWAKVEGDVYVYIDVDMATDLAKFDAFRNLLDNQGKYDLVTGSRYISGSETNRPRLRRFASVAYNRAVRLMFRTGVHDHQCGFKSFSKGLVQVLAVQAKSDSWFWDTEVIVVARKLGFGMREIPIRWIEMKGPRTPIRRLGKDVWIHGSGLVKLFWRVYFQSLKSE